ncbi:phytanoyl-CoA dioxygenase family protein [Kovacikia minuta CCNUW1]|uniref:phytanoyl-CoA dioxygenase family protein n=1 Tax=Kovacikia minuta TaxID=2931930 RepID=UPI001CCA166C|nr:phytanoyl-CoA dioxygenase family protein [Kovacikia minuta]UBF25246.1 phytanoyl-CoA dioxygenase family protein [Kovacikia minuta CCNUW1]
MNEVERYLFDLQGFLIVENALSLEQVAAINELLDQQVNLHQELEKPWSRFDRLLSWGAPFRDLIDNPRITPYLHTLLGNHFRLDHEYVHLIRQPGTGPIGSFLHGGGTPYDPCQYYLYKDGQMYNGLTAVAYQLTDVAPGEGGFGCIPGSHKSHFPVPDALQDLETPHACIQEISAKAGSAIIFTEALTHCTLFWQGKQERRTLFYKYSPCSSAWLRQYYNPDDYPDLTEAQRRILKTPGVRPEM